MKNSIRLIKTAQKNAYDDVMNSFNLKIKEKKDNTSSFSDQKAQKYALIKQKAEEMGISVADYIEHFGSTDEKRLYSNLANQELNDQKPASSDDGFQEYERVLSAFQYIKEKSEELNIPITRIWEDLNLPDDIKRKVLTLVVNYQNSQETTPERKIQTNFDDSNSLENRLKKANENARFYSEQWNQAIDDAEKQNIDPIVYIAAHYPDDIAQQIIAWYKIKTGEINASNMEEYFAQSVEQVSNQEIESFNENYDDNTFQNFVNKAREIAENIDWEKAGAYLDEGKNRVIYQLLKPGSFIKKTSDAIKVVISMLTLKNVEKFNEEYYENQNNNQRAEQELDEYLRTSKMNKRQVIASLNKVANELDNSGMFQEANQITNVMKRLSQYAPAQQPAVPAPVAPAPVAPASVAPPFGGPLVPAVPVPGAVPALGAPAAPAAPAPVTTTTKAPYATSAGAQGTPVDPNEAKENQLYAQAIQNINKYFSAKDSASRASGEKLYENTVTQFKNMQRRGRFMNQVQGLRSKYFPAQSLNPGK